MGRWSTWNSYLLPVQFWTKVISVALMKVRHERGKPPAETLMSLATGNTCSRMNQCFQSKQNFGLLCRNFPGLRKRRFKRALPDSSESRDTPRLFCPNYHSGYQGKEQRPIKDNWLTPKVTHDNRDIQVQTLGIHCSTKQSLGPKDFQTKTKKNFCSALVVLGF